jgi:hypothetical protein
MAVVIYISREKPVVLEDGIDVRLSHPERRVPLPGDELLCVDRHGEVVRRFDATKVQAYRLM